MHFIKQQFPIFLLLCLSGNPIITAFSYSKTILAIYTILFAIFTLSITNTKYIYRNSTKLSFIIIIILLIALLQYLKFGIISPPGVLALILKIVLAWATYLYYNFKRINFLALYIKTLVVFTLLSFPFWILNQFISLGIQTDNHFIKSTIFYTMYPVEIQEGSFAIRNSGMFWEPGAFAGYIILALLFIFVLNKGFDFKNFKKEFIVLSIGILSTQSTTGYIMYGLIVVIHFAYNYKYLRYVLLPIVVVLFFYVYSDVGFLNKKIKTQNEEALLLDKNEISNTRMGALIMDWQYIKDSPIIGNGLHEKTRWRFHTWVKEDIGHGNGMSNFTVWWGIPLFLFWILCVYRFIKYSTNNRFLSVTISMLFVFILQGEQFLNFPLFLLFFILPLKYDKLKIQHRNNFN